MWDCGEVGVGFGLRLGLGLGSPNPSLFNLIPPLRLTHLPFKLQHRHHLLKPNLPYLILYMSNQFHGFGRGRFTESRPTSILQMVSKVYLTFSRCLVPCPCAVLGSLTSCSHLFNSFAFFTSISFASQIAIGQDKINDRRDST